MSYSKAGIPDEIYHLTRRANLDFILADKKVRRFQDQECWFCRSIPHLLRYMEYTVLCEGKRYIDADGRWRRYPAFVPEDHVVLKLTPQRREGNWYQWNQDYSADSPPDYIMRCKEFSGLKIGFRGDLRFKAVEVLELSQIMSPLPMELTKPTMQF